MRAAKLVFFSAVVALAILSACSSNDRSLEIDSQAITVRVSYDRPIAMLTSGFESVDSFITDVRFPSTGDSAEDVQIVMVSVGGLSSYNWVQKEFPRHKLRPANLRELLALAEVLKDKESCIRVLAAGSAGEGPRGGFFVPSISCCYGELQLQLSWAELLQLNTTYAAVRQR